MQIDNKNIKNILVVRNDRFGEFLLNMPALRALKETFINARLIVIVNPYVKELAKIIPFIDEVIEWAGERHSLSAKLELVRLLRKKSIDMAVMSNPSQEFNIITFLAAIPVRVGYNRKWGFLLTHKIEDKKYLGNNHEVEYNLQLVRLVGAQTTDKQLSLKIQDDIIKKLVQEFNIEDCNNSVVIHPWTSDPIKQWPIENFKQLAQRLSQELNKKVIIIGGKEELSQEQRYFDNLGSGIINLTARTTLIQLAALLKKAKLLISGDSGPVHLCACVQTPVIAIFRNDLPGKSAKRWGPWGAGHMVIEKNNLNDITVDEVFDKVRSLSGR